MDFSTAYDVVVCGGGIAGVAAALSSALATRASTAAASSSSTPKGSATVTGNPAFSAASLAKAGMSSLTCLPRERK